MSLQFNNGDETIPTVMNVEGMPAISQIMKNFKTHSQRQANTIRDYFLIRTCQALHEYHGEFIGRS